jgi:hypothetical protein
MRRITVGRLESLQRAGVIQLPKSKGIRTRRGEAETVLVERPAAEAASPSEARGTYGREEIWLGFWKSNPV